jgi:tetrathionate reductase subunit B
MSQSGRQAMALDLAACVGCAACAVACHFENGLPVGKDRMWVRERESGTFPNLQVEYRPEACQHCQNPACVSACPTGASYQTKDGVVLVDQRRCIACGACIAACPYDARFLHPDGYVDKCTFCHHRTVVGRAPACVETCPTGARTFGDLDDPRSPVAKAIHAAGKVDVLKPELGTKPKFFYLNAPFKNCLREEVHQ